MNKKVRAKFKVSQVMHTEAGNSIQLIPVSVGSEENKEFYRYTPSGQIELSIVNQESASFFEVGQEYYVDFSLAPKLVAQ